jgi:hypothetical protein
VYNERWVATGGVSGGRTARMRQIMDTWLMAHPGKKAFIIDPKRDTPNAVYTVEKRWFEPHLQLEEGRKDGS